MASRFEQPRMGRRSGHPHAGRLERLRQWWWDRDRRRLILETERREYRHLLDEDHILDAFARQLEEIRRLPELAL